jgi:hypothetical protein
MKSMKANLIIALAIGTLIATVLLVLEPLTDYSLLSLELPGVTAAYLFWGVVGGPASPSSGCSLWRCQSNSKLFRRSQEILGVPLQIPRR